MLRKVSIGKENRGSLFLSRPQSQNDMGYLLKVLTAAPLPPLEAEFRDLLAIWFPRLYDIKYIMKATRPIKVGLQELADEFQVGIIKA